MPTLRIVRDSGYADRLRAYQVVVDNAKIGSVRNGETKEFPVAAGDHRVKAAVDWCGSSTVAFHAAEGETVTFQVRSALRGPRVFLALWKVLFDQNSYLMLERVEHRPEMGELSKGG